jgi:hypothetical protein
MGHLQIVFKPESVHRARISRFTDRGSAVAASSRRRSASVGRFAFCGVGFRLKRYVD